MRLTALGNRLALLAALAGACSTGSGCRRVPYIDQSKVVPEDPGSLAAHEDAAVRQAAFLDEPTSIPIPRVMDPRTLENPERPEIWELTLQDAIRIGLDNSEVVRVIPLGAQGIPVQGFEPQFLAIGQINTLGAGNLSTVYDPAIQETRIASALSAFDANIATTLFWSRNVLPFNNAIQSGIFAPGIKFPIVSFQDTAQFSSTLQKRIATGGTVGITQNVNYQFQNNPTNAFPSAYTTNLQLKFSHPLLGSAPTSQFNPNPLPSGLEANRAPIVIARLRADFTTWQFKSQVMNMVRSVEQQYWALAQAQVQYWAAETAVDLGEQIVKREKAKYAVGQGSIPNVAEAEEQLERFKLDFVQRTADLITTERQLRNLLGLPPTDNRRIVPVTAPTEARLEPNWQASLAQMLDFQPDIVQGQLLVRVAELQLLVARNQLLPVLNFDALYQFNGLGHTLDQSLAVMTGKTIQAVNPIIQSQQRAAGLNATPGFYSAFQSWQLGLTFQMPLGYRGPLADVRLAQYTLLQQRAYVQQIVHQTTHQLARFFLEVDANYKAFKTASRLKAAALQRLEAQKAFYEEGTITIDRYLDAVNRWANAVTLEAQFRTQYNIAIVALEEAKGTLLGYDNVAVAEGPWPRKAYIQAHDQQRAHGQRPTGDDGNYLPRPSSGPVMPDEVPPVTPPGFKPEDVPPLPRPGGTIGPRGYPTPPADPAGEPPILMQRPAIGNGAGPESEVRRVGMPGAGDPGAGGLPALPVGVSAPVEPPPAAPGEPAPAPEPEGVEMTLDLPTAPAELPALPTSPPAPMPGGGGDMPALPDPAPAGGDGGDGMPALPPGG
jgi:outer membrane protein TolC